MSQASDHETRSLIHVLLPEAALPISPVPAQPSSFPPPGTEGQTATTAMREENNSNGNNENREKSTCVLMPAPGKSVLPSLPPSGWPLPSTGPRSHSELSAPVTAPPTCPGPGPGPGSVLG